MPTSFRVGRRQNGSHVNREWTDGPAKSKNPRTLRNNMHENREISSAPWSDDQGRSAKAINETGDQHVLEKSDCAVVPVNQPNKGGKPSAEAVEGRARAVENIVRSHMLPTQSGNCMSQGTGGVRQAVLPPLIHGKSRMRRRARTDLCRGAISDGRPNRDS